MTLIPPSLTLILDTDEGMESNSLGHSLQANIREVLVLPWAGLHGLRGLEALGRNADLDVSSAIQKSQNVAWH